MAQPKNYQSVERVDVENGPPHMFVLLVGKTGNGKSSVGNTLVGEEKFPTGRSLATTTLEMQCADTVKEGFHLTIIDTPDVTNREITEAEMEEEVNKWKSAIGSAPYMVLLTIRCDVRYTAEEYDIYKNFLKLWGDDSVKHRMVVAFTFGDRQDKDIGEELQMVCQELKNVLNDAEWRYVVFDNTADLPAKEKPIRQIMDFIEVTDLGPLEHVKVRCDNSDRIQVSLIILLILVTIACFLLKFEFELQWYSVGVGAFGIVLALFLIGFSVYKIKVRRSCPCC